LGKPRKFGGLGRLRKAEGHVVHRGASPATAPRVGRPVLLPTGRVISPTSHRKLASLPQTSHSPRRRSEPKLTHQLASQPCTMFTPDCYRQLVDAPLPVHRWTATPCTSAFYPRPISLEAQGRRNDDRVPPFRFPLPLPFWSPSKMPGLISETGRTALHGHRGNWQVNPARRLGPEGPSSGVSPPSVRRCRVS
jgi:hypothetical protein